MQADGAYKWVGPFSSTNEYRERRRDGEVEAKREAALKAMRDLGHVE